MRVVLISTYELGRQPFGLASAAAWLQREGAAVTCLDLAVEELSHEAVRAADLVAFYVPMHTATRIACHAARRVREINPTARFCFYGLYAPLNELYLREVGAEFVLGGEFEESLVQVYRQVKNKPRESQPGAQTVSPVSLGKLAFIMPDRSGLPPLSSYAKLRMPDGSLRITGYAEASRGCKHFCRHCPIVPVYQGNFRIVQREVVLKDIRQQVAGGAEHITFGDPDFFNGVSHAVRLVTQLHSEFPNLSYDVTIKVEHLLEHARFLPALRDTGCAFVTTAVEALDDPILERLDKGHTEADFYRVVQLFKKTGLTLAPTFVAFTPWTSMEGYLYLLQRLVELDLVESVPPIQLTIRLLIPSGSRLLELAEVRDLIEGFDKRRLCYPWRHPDARMDELQRELQDLVREMGTGQEGRAEGFPRIWDCANAKAGCAARLLPMPAPLAARASIPYLTEPWYC